MPTAATMTGAHPPSFLWRPLRVNGTPVARAIRPLSAEIPTARRHEKEKPNLRIIDPLHSC